LSPSVSEIEAIVANLMQQGLLHGFVSHNLARFAIIRAKVKSWAVKAGFLLLWEVISAREQERMRDGEEEVPGWK
jgi:nuclear mRNA export protein PCID2/THP1